MNWQIFNKNRIEDYKRIDVADLKRLLSEKNLHVYSEISGTSNTTYGIAHHLKRYAEIDTNIPLNCTLEHGLCFMGTVCQSEVSHHNSRILTISPYREKIIKELTELIPVVIGPYIAYVENYRPKEYIDEVKKKNGRTLLVMPSHSIQGMNVEYDIKQFIQKIEKVKTELYINYHDIGVYVPIKQPKYGDTDYEYDVYEQLHCVRSARRMELKADKEIILSSMLRSMQRDLIRNKGE